MTKLVTTKTDIRMRPRSILLTSEDTFHYELICLHIIIIKIILCIEIFGWMSLQIKY